jgi:hypothetical protein
LYERGLLGPPAQPAALVPVRITDTAPAVEASLHGARKVPSGSIQIDLAHARVQIEGAADPSTLRTVLEFLRG